MSWQFKRNTLLAKDVCDSLRAQNKTLAVAESCTGGLLAAFLTEIPGSSRVFLGGITCYSDTSKSNILSISQTLLNSVGAVSEEVATGLAKQVCTLFDADFGIGVTGIAGPDGGSPAKPVGTVWYAFSANNRKLTECLHLSGTRREIRLQSVEKILIEFSNFLKG